MIKIFRRLRYSLMTEGKTFRYLKYAVGEILLVMVGILLALQVNNWNEERKLRKKERYYLNSVQLSIDLSQKEFSRVIRDAESISSSADTLFRLMAVNDEKLLKGRFLDSLLFFSGDYSLISLNDGGVQEILNSGALDVIKDERIRRYLATWNGRLHEIRKHEEFSEYYAKRYNNHLREYLDIRRLVEDSTRGLVIPKKRQQLMSDVQLSNYLAEISDIHSGMKLRYEREKKLLDSLSDFIDRYLEYQ